MDHAMRCLWSLVRPCRLRRVVRGLWRGAEREREPLDVMVSRIFDLVH
jgi:hypothetical protein